MICLIFLISTGCAPDRTLPDWEPPVVEIEAEEPLPLCEYPDLIEIEREGIDYVALNAAGLVVLLQCIEVAEANYRVAAANAESVRAMISAYQKSAEIGDLQQDLAEFQLNELDADRRDAVVETWITRGLLAVVLVAVAL